jgi:hypothetical protein
MVKTNKDPGKKKRRCWRVVTDGRESSEFPTGAKHVVASFVTDHHRVDYFQGKEDSHESYA